PDVVLGCRSIASHRVRTERNDTILDHDIKSDSRAEREGKDERRRTRESRKKELCCAKGRFRRFDFIELHAAAAKQAGRQSRRKAKAKDSGGAGASIVIAIHLLLRRSSTAKPTISNAQSKPARVVLPARPPAYLGSLNSNRRLPSPICKTKQPQPWPPHSNTSSPSGSTLSSPPALASRPPRRASAARSAPRGAAAE
ncbi:hypothetical protein BKA80DRAFT_343674, partial [Phyllosticta citrichinensis]